MVPGDATAGRATLGATTVGGTAVGGATVGGTVVGGTIVGGATVGGTTVDTDVAVARTSTVGVVAGAGVGGNVACRRGVGTEDPAAGVAVDWAGVALPDTTLAVAAGVSIGVGLTDGATVTVDRSRRPGVDDGTLVRDGTASGVRVGDGVVVDADVVGVPSGVGVVDASTSAGLTLEVGVTLAASDIAETPPPAGVEAGLPGSP